MPLIADIHWQHDGFQHHIQATASGTVTAAFGTQLAVEVDTGVGTHRQAAGITSHRGGAFAAQVQIRSRAGDIDHRPVADNDELVVDFVEAAGRLLGEMAAQCHLAAVQYFAITTTASIGGRVRIARSIQHRVLTNPD